MTHTPYSETVVNTTTSGRQTVSATLALDDGGWVVVWDSAGQDGSGYGVYQQVYNADGSARGDETQVNTYTSDNQYFRSVTALADGGWLVTMESVGQDGDNRGIYAQRFDANGDAVGEEQQVNTTTTGRQTGASTTLLAEGGWLVTWTSWNAVGDDSEIYQQRYDADGATVGGETRVNTHVTSWQSDPLVTSRADGGWVVAWISNNQDGSGTGMYQQVYDADGNTVGGESLVNSNTSGDQGGNPTITTLADGGWVVIWTSGGQDGSFGGIYQQRYDADGGTVGEEIQVNTYTSGDQSLLGNGTVSLATGGWVVTWSSSGQDGDSSGVYQQAYDANGDPLGAETRVNTYTGSTQLPRTVIALADGGWVQFWVSDDQDGSDYGVYQQVFNADGTAQGQETLVNTTTSGNQAYPQASALADGGWIVSWYSDSTGDYNVLQQRYAASGQIYGTNHAPTAEDITIDSLSNGAYKFSKDTFGFSDGNDGDSFASVVITSLPSAGKLLLDGVAVTADRVIDSGDLRDLVWKAGKKVQAAEIEYQLVDDGGTVAGGKDTSEVHTVSFAATSNTVMGTNKADRLVGTDIHDDLVGKRGDDRLTGGDGADWFVFQPNGGRDTVTDFGLDKGDRVVLSFLDDIASWKDLTRNHFEDHGRDLWITSNHDTTIVLRNVEAGDLDRSDFVF